MDIEKDLKDVFQFEGGASFEGNVKRVKKILSAYNVEDAVIFAFSCSSWLENRPIFHSTMAINKAVTQIETFGDRKINSYTEFSDLCDRVRNVLLESYVNSTIPMDYGEVKIKYEEEAYFTLIGTGEGCSFGVLKLIPYLSKCVKKEEILKHGIRHLSGIIEKTRSDNIYKTFDARLNTPSQPYFESVCKLFDDRYFENINPDLISDLTCKCTSIEHQHFFTHHNKLFPLFNPSIILDLYAAWTEYDNILPHNILCLSENLSATYNTPNWIGVFQEVILRDVNGKPLSDFIMPFVLSEEQKLILFFDKRLSKTGNLKKAERTIRRLHKKDCLFISELRPVRDDLVLGKKIKVDCSITFVEIVDSMIYHKEIIHPRVQFSYLDLIYALSLTENLEELISFINYTNLPEQKIHLINGFYNLIPFWKNTGRLEKAGNLSEVLLHTGEYDADQYIAQYCSNELATCPFYLPSFQTDPFMWTCKKHESGVFEYKSKNEEIVGYSSVLNNGSHLFSTVEISRINNEDRTRNYERINATINLQIRFHQLCSSLEDPKTENEHILLTHNTKIDSPTFYGKFSEIAIAFEENLLYLNYTFDFEKYITESIKIGSENAEIEFYLDLIKPIETLNVDLYGALKKIILSPDNKVRVLPIANFETDVYMSSNFRRHALQKNSRAGEKMIADICHSKKIQSGFYCKNDATDIIRTVQSKILEKMIDEIKLYDRKNLLEKVMSSISFEQCEYLRSQIIEKNLSESYFDEEQLPYLRKVTFEQYSSAFINNFIQQYLLEILLTCDPTSSKRLCTKDCLEYLHSMASRLFFLQTAGDICYFDEKSQIYISNNYQLILQPSNALDEKNSERQKNYETELYIGSEDLTFELMEKIMDAFFEDCGFHFSLMLAVLTYFSFDFQSNKEHWEEKMPNVIYYDSNFAIDDIMTFVEFQKEGHISTIPVKPGDILNVLEFLTLDVSKIKTKKGKPTNYIPIGDREGRDNRFETKPLIFCDGHFIFCPSSFKMLERMWINGILQRYPPYEYGLNKFVSALDELKKKQEQSIVFNVVKIFEDSKIIAWPNVDLHKKDRKNNPKDLGDYDVIAFDEKNRKIYLIECKVFQRAGSVYEFASQLRRFDGKKYAEKFQKRIEFFSKNYARIINSFGAKAPECKIAAYMVTNKNVYTNSKPSFEIIPYYEFKKMIESHKKEQT